MTRAHPVVAIYDPLWGIDWSFEVERSRLHEHGVELRVPEREDAVASAVADADVVIVVDRHIGKEELRGLSRCIGIVCYGVGIDAVDPDAAARAGIPVRNVPGYCTDEVSDHAIALLVALERRLFTIVAEGRDWQAGYREAWPIRRMRGQTLGVVGAGRIGRMAARKARAFGFRTIAFDPYISDTGDPDLSLKPFDELLESSDAVVLCASLTETSSGMFNSAAFQRMKAGALLVNVARGGLVHELALAQALRSGRLSGAALDVRTEEPPPDADPFGGMPNVILTPHIGAASVDSREDLHTGAAAVALELLADAGRIPRSPKQPV
jgi:D-3-phosphoglycerate dehydrogenase